MRLSTVLPVLFALGVIAKIRVPAVHLRDNGLTRRQLLEGKICRFFEQKLPPFYYDLSTTDETLESYVTPDNESSSSMLTKHENPDRSLKVPPVPGGAFYLSGQLGAPRYGGRYSDNRLFNRSHTVGKNEWWTLDKDSREWATIQPRDSDGLLRADGMASVNVPVQGLAFSIGGLVNNWTDSTYKDWGLAPEGMIALRSMLIYDTRKHEVKNVTISPLPAQWGGVVEYVPVGKKGVLVLIGGFESDKTAITASDKSLKEMNKVHLYDIYAGEWYTQIARGSIPKNRAFACASVASASDNSSHNIFVHGGTDGAITTYSDTYVLSLPSFKWIKVGSGLDTQSRLGHNCHMTAKYRMLVLGGRGQDQDVPALPFWDTGVCDKYAMINVFDVNTLRWLNSRNPKDGDTRFKVNRVITAVIGGNKPEDGWGSHDIGALFDSSLPTRVPSSMDKKQRPAKPPPGGGSSGGASQAARTKVGTIGLIVMTAIAAAIVA
ncbi:hypothetical protein C7212DRAFT_363446 [Tuber magnatum]|uniref:Galactose oxidase n=1 Tax=Tuber magnatum TaxID=42249 RepID=A0A317SPF4_9PEZI|nr:hypothetical protein C7212DRAFT_363446 [Tuber magnatum]